MTDATPRLALPLLVAGQAQKELFHNEALTVIDMLVQPAVASAGIDVPPPAPATGQGWIVGPAPSGAWAGHAHSLACWTDGGWRFVAPFEGMCLWVLDVALPARWHAGAWAVGTIAATEIVVAGSKVLGARRPPIANPAGGTTVDAPARTAIDAVLAALREHGIIAA
jgi:hypothetical protein